MVPLWKFSAVMRRRFTCWALTILYAICSTPGQSIASVTYSLSTYGQLGYFICYGPHYCTIYIVYTLLPGQRCTVEFCNQDITSLYTHSRFLRSCCIPVQIWKVVIATPQTVELSGYLSFVPSRALPHALLTWPSLYSPCLA